MTRVLACCAALAAALLVAATNAGPARGQQKPADKEMQNTDPKVLAARNNDFGLALLKKLHKPGENTFMSPTSVSTALQLAAQAAAGETRAEMHKAMGVTGLDVPGHNQALLEALNSRKGVTLNSANSIWANSRMIELNPLFEAEAVKYFKAEARSLDFAQSGALDTINTWVADRTNQKIPNLISVLPPESAAVLVNAVYFKGQWQSPFDKKETAPADFIQADGTRQKVQMMQGEPTLKAFEAEGRKAVYLPFGKADSTKEKSAKVGMWLALPAKDETLEAFAARLDAAMLAQWQKQGWQREVMLRLPRFGVRFKKELNDELIGLGMKQAFTGGADFSRLAKDGGQFFISKVIHEAVLDVNEEGAEAAAATAVVMESGAPPQEFRFDADRPFVVLIVDEDTGSVLFAGLVHKPESK